jgi:hypothetical protein
MSHPRLIGLLCVLLLVVSCAAKPTPQQVVEKYLDGFSKNDVDAQLAVFAEDAMLTYSDQRELSFSGQTAIRNWLEFQAALNSHLVNNDCKLDGNAVDCAWALGNDCSGWDKPGGHNEPMSLSATVRDAKIQKLSITKLPNPEDEKFDPVWFAYLQEAYPQELAAFIEDLGKGNYGKDLGVSMDKLCVAFWASKQ